MKPSVTKLIVAGGWRWIFCGAVWALACAPRTERAAAPNAHPERAAYSQSEEVTLDLLPGSVPDRTLWTRGIVDALEENHLPSSPEYFCAVAAVVEQESGFHANPSVPGLPKLVLSRLQAQADKLGPLSQVALRKVLDGRAPGTQVSFRARIASLKTERDVDRLFRDLLLFSKSEFPRAFATAGVIGEFLGANELEDLNPITTAGPMQVNVHFARELAQRERRSVEGVREELYTLAGGLFYGVARLWRYDAAYEGPLYRFADYNAGLYASRNAALQEQVRALGKEDLALDGDWLSYDRVGEPLSRPSRSYAALLKVQERWAADELPPGRIRRDLLLEKRGEFERTQTVQILRRLYQRRLGKAPQYARMPEVLMDSPKMRRPRSTASYAASVMARHRACLERAGR
jgi:hypothetical protein